MGLLVVFATSAVVSASASASAAPQFFVCNKVAETGKFKDHLCQEEMAKGNWEYETVGAAESFEVEGTSGLSAFEGTLLNVLITNECKKSSARGTLESNGRAKGTVTLSECSLFVINKTHHKEQLSNCTVESIIFSIVGQLIKGKGHGPEVEIKPEGEGTKFVELTIAGATCTLKSKTSVEVEKAGQGVFCSLPKAVFSEVRHEGMCTTTGDEHLRFGGKPASQYMLAIGTGNLTNGSQAYAE